MPEKEFELYLSLLVRLLRLSPEQKSSIEAELRDHFESRFEELVRRNVPRDVAIRRTLEEFGDAAGLAREFTHLSRKPIGRRIMQGTLATAGITAAVVAVMMLFRVPEPVLMPMPEIVAQDEAPKADAASPSQPEPAAQASAAETVEWVDPGQFLPGPLGDLTEVEFTGTPLRDVMSYLSTLHDVPILFDMPTLNEVGATGDEEISIRHQASVYAVLDMILRDVAAEPLAWVWKSEAVQITTKARSNELLQTQYFPVRDLLDAGLTPDDLMDTLQNGTEGPWESVDGMGGSLEMFGDLLIVRQSQPLLAETACLLQALRGTTRERHVAEPPQHERIFAVLDEPTSIEFQGTPLKDVVNYLAELHNVPIFLDMYVLQEIGMNGDEEVSVVVNGIKLRSALDLLLASAGTEPLDYIVRDGALWITTAAVAENFRRTMVYDVSDITAGETALMERLVSAIENQTDGQWMSIHGTGGTISTPTAGLLVVRQSRRTHDEVRELLGALRESLAHSGGDRKFLTEATTRLETRFYRMDAAAAEDIARLLPELVRPGTWRLPMFGGPVQPAQSKPEEVGTIHRLAAGKLLVDVDTGIVTREDESQPQTEPASDEEKSKPMPAPAKSNVVVIPQAVLIVTHRPAVLQEISRLLRSLLDNESASPRGDLEGKVRFLSPGFQEGTWHGALGAGGPSPQVPGEGFFSVRTN